MSVSIGRYREARRSSARRSESELSSAQRSAAKQSPNDEHLARTQTKARLDLTGVTGLVLNNAQLADPTNEYTIKIKAITDKGVKMTPEDREQREALEWTGSLYLDGRGLSSSPDGTSSAPSGTSRPPSRLARTSIVAE